MGGGRRPPGDFIPHLSSSSSSSSSSYDDDDDLSSSDDSQITELPPPERCHPRLFLRSRSNALPLSSYPRARALRNSRDIIRRYKPGDFIEDADRAEKYEIPENTTLLLIGGSGKSALVSKLKSVFDKLWSASTLDTAPVPDDSSSVDDPCSLQEHMILGDSTSICVFDSPSWSVFPEENCKILQKWMKNGVCHGEMNICDSINANVKANNMPVRKECEFRLNKKRMVNYVILVLDATSILKSIDTQDTRYLDIVCATFNYPFLSFKGNKPAVVVINGDQLSSVELSHVLNSIGDLLNIPLCHIFNISGIDSYQTKLDILNLLRYCLEKADHGLPLKHKTHQEKQESEHIMRMVHSNFDIIIDICIAYLCLLILWGITQACGFSLRS